MLSEVISSVINQKLLHNTVKVMLKMQIAFDQLDLCRSSETKDPILKPGSFAKQLLRHALEAYKIFKIKHPANYVQVFLKKEGILQECQKIIDYLAERGLSYLSLSAIPSAFRSFKIINIFIFSQEHRPYTGEEFIDLIKAIKALAESDDAPLAELQLYQSTLASNLFAPIRLIESFGNFLEHAPLDSIEQELYRLLQIIGACLTFAETQENFLTLLSDAAASKNDIQSCAVKILEACYEKQPVTISTRDYISLERSNISFPALLAEAIYTIDPAEITLNLDLSGFTIAIDELATSLKSQAIIDYSQTHSAQHTHFDRIITSVRHTTDALVALLHSLEQSEAVAQLLQSFLNAKVNLAYLQQLFLDYCVPQASPYSKPTIAATMATPGTRQKTLKHAESVKYAEAEPADDSLLIKPSCHKTLFPNQESQVVTPEARQTPRYDSVPVREPMRKIGSTAALKTSLFTTFSPLSPSRFRSAPASGTPESPAVTSTATPDLSSLRAPYESSVDDHLIIPPVPAPNDSSASPRQK